MRGCAVIAAAGAAPDYPAGCGPYILFYRKVSLMNIVYGNELSVEEYCMLRKSVGWYDVHEDIVRQSLDRSDFIVSARVGGKPVGMARMMTDEMQVLIMDVAVHPDYQGHNIGRELIEHIIRHVKGKYDQMLINLTTADHNAGFYEKLGFSKTTGMRIWHGIIQA
jgi:GNAT superfamily N-acetyltransferase